MKSITQNDHQMKLVSTQIANFFQTYHVSHLLRRANASKLKGFPAVQIFLLAVSILFQHCSLYMQMKLHQDALPFSKDTFYRFFNSCRINWRKFTMLLAKEIIQKTLEPLTSEERVNVLIVDDSFYSRSRSKKVELLANTYDHAHHVTLSGFRLLTLGWSDGNTFLPLNHCLLSTENKKNRINEASRTIDPRTNGGKQRKLAQTKAPEVVLQMLRETKGADIPARYVLFDTWFCSPSSLIQIKEIGYDTIAMAKKSSKIHYKYKGKKMDVMSIYKANKKRRGRSKYLLSVEAEVEKDEKSIPVKLVFVRNRNKRKDYLVLVSTDLSLSEEEIIRLYGKRWGIEVFFKMCKSYLKLEKECRSLSYDAMTAHVAVVFTRYMMLAVEQRESEDQRSFGELFYLCIEELDDIRYEEALQRILSEFADEIEHCMVLTEKAVQCLLTAFFDKLSNIWSSNLRKCA